jgi:small subunit ribosomal protein S20
VSARFGDPREREGPAPWRTHRARLRSAVKQYRKAIEAGDAELAARLLRPVLGLVDHTAKLGALHDNAAARAKSRLTRALHRLNAG